MHELSLSLRGNFFFRPAVLINGERVRVRRVSGGYACKYATDLCAVRVEVCRFFELNAPFWLPVALLFMVLGCFGIFAPSYDKKCFAPDLCFEVTVPGKSEVTLTFCPPVEGVRAAEFASSSPYYEHSDVWYTDAQAKRRAKILRIVRAVMVVSALVAAGLIAALLLR